MYDGLETKTPRGYTSHSVTSERISSFGRRIEKPDPEEYDSTRVYVYAQTQRGRQLTGTARDCAALVRSSRYQCSQG